MYQHCETNRLTEVWAYLWVSWYAPEKWPIWARSADPVHIPCHRTTMVVEALWRNMKRISLRMYNRPPLDLTNFIIITQTLPPYRLTLGTLLSVRGGGRPEALTHMQTAFKRAWEALSKAKIKGTYVTDTSRWTCDCGAQKYHSYLLCKHLVQAAGARTTAWWVGVKRRRTLPFYHIDDPSDMDQNTRGTPETRFEDDDEREEEVQERREPSQVCT